MRAVDVHLDARLGVRLAAAIAADGRAFLDDVHLVAALGQDAGDGAPPDAGAHDEDLLFHQAVSPWISQSLR